MIFRGCIAKINDLDIVFWAHLDFQASPRILFTLLAHFLNQLSLLHFISALNLRNDQFRWLSLNNTSPFLKLLWWVGKLFFPGFKISNFQKIFVWKKRQKISPLNYFNHFPPIFIILSKKIIFFMNFRLHISFFFEKCHLSYLHPIFCFTLIRFNFFLLFLWF